MTINKRVQLDMSLEGLKDLLAVKESLQTPTMADAVRSSIKIVRRLEEEIKRGNKIYLIDKKNQKRELIFV